MIITYYAKECRRMAGSVSTGPPAEGAQSKVRSRKDGAAIPLDDDRQAADEPAAVALPARRGAVRRDRRARPSSRSSETLERTQRLLDGRIIREITPIFDTRALGYGSMLVAAKVDAENPQRAAKIINSHPGRLAQLPADPRVQPLVHDRHPAGLASSACRARSTALQELTGAESIRQLPTLKLFKINMNLEMERRHRGARRASPRPRPRASSRRSPTTTPTSP